VELLYPRLGRGGGGDNLAKRNSKWGGRAVSHEWKEAQEEKCCNGRRERLRTRSKQLRNSKNDPTLQTEVGDLPSGKTNGGQVTI